MEQDPNEAQTAAVRGPRGPEGPISSPGVRVTSRNSRVTVEITGGDRLTLAFWKGAEKLRETAQCLVNPTYAKLIGLVVEFMRALGEKYGSCADFGRLIPIFIEPSIVANGLKMRDFDVRETSPVGRDVGRQALAGAARHSHDPKPVVRGPYSFRYSLDGGLEMEWTFGKVEELCAFMLTKYGKAPEERAIWNAVLVAGKLGVVPLDAKTAEEAAAGLRLAGVASDPPIEGEFSPAVEGILRAVEKRMDAKEPVRTSMRSLEIAGRVWCDPEMRSVVMDPDAAILIAEIVQGVLDRNATSADTPIVKEGGAP